MRELRPRPPQSLRVTIEVGTVITSVSRHLNQFSSPKRSMRTLVKLPASSPPEGTAGDLSPQGGSKRTEWNPSPLRPSSIWCIDDGDSGDSDVGSAGFVMRGAESTRPAKRTRAAAPKLSMDSESNGLLLWVMCDECHKWRSLCDGGDPTALPETWRCEMHPEPSMRSCDVSEEEWDRPVGLATLNSGEDFGLSLDCMLHVLSFLGPSDLCRAAQVSHGWRHAASSPSIWHRTDLAGHRVLDCCEAVSRLAELRVRTLNLRGSSWAPIDPSSAEVFSVLSSLKHIELPPTSAAFLEALAIAAPGLEAVAVELTSPAEGRYASLDFHKIAGLRLLKLLQIRSPYGLSPPVFSFNGGLERLGSLSMLQALELTGLRECAGADFAWLSECPELRALAIGDCTLWGDDGTACEALGTLTRLESLRLEVGGSFEGQLLAATLSKLTRLVRLELMLWDVAQEIGPALASLPELQSLTVQPLAVTDEDARADTIVNQRCFDAVTAAIQISEMRWCLLSPELSAVGLVLKDSYETVTPHMLRSRLERSLPGAVVQVLTSNNASCIGADFMIEEFRKEGRRN